MRILALSSIAYVPQRVFYKIHLGRCISGVKSEGRKSIEKMFLPQSPDTLPFACTLLGPCFWSCGLGAQSAAPEAQQKWLETVSRET